MENSEGIVFNIQHFCIHDGPGIRTGVFFKGCPLHCRWCANPESQTPRPQILWYKDKCTGCGNCMSVCPSSALYKNGEKIGIRLNACTGCGLCVDVCPNGARELCGKQESVDEVMNQVLEDKLFYSRDGGITLTGGEVLMQPEFAEALLISAKENGLTTAVETSGYGLWSAFKKIAPHCDIFLYDIKHTDSDLHRLYTGIDNAVILKNLRRLSDEYPNCEIRLRVPVIPGFNDCQKNMNETGKIAASLQSCSGVELLPYHNLGEGKRQQLGDDASFSAEIPSEEKMESLREIVRSWGKPVI